jgi:hypothetical protein
MRRIRFPVAFQARVCRIEWYLASQSKGLVEEISRVIDAFEMLRCRTNPWTPHIRIGMSWLPP